MRSSVSPISTHLITLTLDANAVVTPGTSPVEVVDGLERAPETLNRLFTGDHTGKLLVRVSDVAD